MVKQLLVRLMDKKFKDFGKKQILLFTKDSRQGIWDMDGMILNSKLSKI
jgi:hypothetical protein